jgi:hypothetical protein
VKEWIVDRWLTWRTGKDRQQREYEAWYYTTVNIRASTAEDMYKNFKYLIQVNADKFLVFHMFTEPKDDLREYRCPQRELGDNILWTILRGEQMPDGKFHITDFGYEDRVYIATNNSEDAMMLALKYG